MKIRNLLWAFFLFVLSGCGTPAAAIVEPTRNPPTPAPTFLSATFLPSPTVTAPQTPEPTPLPVFPSTYISAGGMHTCAVTDKGGLKCWGENRMAQLGSGRITNRDLAVDVVGLQSGVVSVAAGWYHSCALIRGGGVKCWGFNVQGELGDGTTTLRVEPVDVLGLSSGVVALTAGYGHTCALLEGGGVKCWGDNQYGQLGNGTAADSLQPSDVIGLDGRAVAISAGGTHTCALTVQGKVKCWGDDGFGQLGNGSTKFSNQPVDVFLLNSDVVAIAAGWSHTCALENGGGLKCWGDNQSTELGVKKNSAERSATWVQVESLPKDVVAIYAGWQETCVLTAPGVAFCWGDNKNGTLGIGSKVEDVMTPTAVVGLDKGVVAMALGGQHACALTGGGLIKCWGANYSGQLGNGTNTNTRTPLDVVGITGWILP